MSTTNNWAPICTGATLRQHRDEATLALTAIRGTSRDEPELYEQFTSHEDCADLTLIYEILGHFLGAILQARKAGTLPRLLRIAKIAKRVL